MKFKQTLRLVCVAALITGLVACGEEPDPYEPYRHRSADSLYHEAQHAMKKGDYHEAATKFDALNALYPFNRRARQAQLNLVYTHYEDQEPELASVAADRYIRLYPRAKHIDYAYYMKGLLEFKRGLTWLQRLAGADPAERDLTHLHNAYMSFNRIVQHHKHSVYRPDAIRRMVYIRNAIAKEYVRIARLYFKRKAYVATVNRCNDVILHYQGAPVLIDALHLIVDAYNELGLKEMAAQYQALYDSNYGKASHATKTAA